MEILDKFNFLADARLDSDPVSSPISNIIIQIFIGLSPILIFTSYLQKECEEKVNFQFLAKTQYPVCLYLLPSISAPFRYFISKLSHLLFRAWHLCLPLHCLWFPVNLPAILVPAQWQSGKRQIAAGSTDGLLMVGEEAGPSNGARMVVGMVMRMGWAHGPTR